MSVSLEVKVGLRAPGLLRFRKGLGDPAERQEAHARIAKASLEFTKRFVEADASHATAARLGATPTGHAARTAKKIEAEGTPEAAILKIPRKSRLRAAFGDFEIRPGSGKTYLCLPAHAATYGKMPSSFPKDAFKFAILHAHRIFPVLLFASGPEQGNVAFWLRRSVKIKENRALLPWDQLPVLAARVAGKYLTELAQA